MQPRYQFVSRSSTETQHVDTYIITYGDGSATQVERTVPKRLGKTLRDRRVVK
jgi:hypothetical protein